MENNFNFEKISIDSMRKINGGGISTCKPSGSTSCGQSDVWYLWKKNNTSSVDTDNQPVGHLDFIGEPCH